MTNRKQVLAAPGISVIDSKKNKYRARKTVNGQRVTFYTNNLKEAKRWIKSNL